MEYESYEKPSFDRGTRRPSSGGSRFGGGNRGPPRRNGGGSYGSSSGGYGGNRGGGDFERRSFAPVRVGEELDVTIEALAEKGDGVAKKNGFVLFVPNTKVGDRVKIRVNKVLRKVGFAEAIGQASSDAPQQESRRPVQPEQAPKQSDSEDFGEDSPSQESYNNTEEEYSDDFGNDEEQ